MLPSTSAVSRAEQPGAGLSFTCRDCPTREHCLPGQLLGLDALSSHTYCCDAVALCDSTVCAISYAMLTSLIQQRSALLLRFHALFGTELALQQKNMLLLGNAKAPQRLAAFLMDLATGHQAPEPPAAAFELRMSRDDIASHLGLALERVSRQLTQFHAAGLLEVQTPHRVTRRRCPAGHRDFFIEDSIEPDRLRAFALADDVQEGGD